MASEFDKTAFAGLMKAQFGPVHFPVETLSVDGVQRAHMHEFPHTDGGKLERLGRKPYSVKITPIFDEGIFTYDTLNGCPLYPDALVNLHGLWTKQTIADLVIPTMGTISAFMVTFRRTISPNLRSGERIDLEFVEVMNDKFALGEAVVRGGTSGPEQLKLLMNIWDIKFREELGTAEEKNVFDRIEAAANAVFAVQDQGELYATRVEAKVRKLTGILSEAEKRLDRLQHPENHPLLDAIKELWVAANEVAVTATKNIRPHEYEVPTLMTIQQVSRAIYGTTARGVELLQINDLADADAIPRGTRVRFIEQSSRAGF